MDVGGGRAAEALVPATGVFFEIDSDASASEGGVVVEAMLKLRDVSGRLWIL